MTDWQDHPALPLWDVAPGELGGSLEDAVAAKPRRAAIPGGWRQRTPDLRKHVRHPFDVHGVSRRTFDIEAWGIACGACLVPIDSGHLVYVVQAVALDQRVIGREPHPWELTRGHFKIGTTTNFRARLRCLRTGAPRIAVVGVFSGSLAMERQLHDELALYRVAGEWFRDAAFVREVVYALRACLLEERRWRDRA